MPVRLFGITLERQQSVHVAYHLHLREDARAQDPVSQQRQQKWAVQRSGPVQGGWLAQTRLQLWAVPHCEVRDPAGLQALCWWEHAGFSSANAESRLRRRSCSCSNFSLPFIRDLMDKRWTLANIRNVALVSLRWRLSPRSPVRCRHPLPARPGWLRIQFVPFPAQHFSLRSPAADIHI